MINNTVLVGRLTKEVDVRYTGSGIAVGNFTMAVERNFKNAQGEQETDFINCVIWREKAETLASFASKGSLIGITGSIQTGSYDNSEGRTIYTTEVNVDNFQMLEPKSVNEERKEKSKMDNTRSMNNTNQGYGNNPPPRTGGGYNNGNYNQNENPFATYNQNNSGGSNDVTDISDDDLPF